MSLSHTLQLHIEQLREIRSILKAMKNLAFMELHKLKGGTDRQSEVVAHLEQVALDFLYYYPLPVEEGVTFLSIGVLLGAERGFCGDFNESLLKSIVNQDFKQVITIGNRLCNLLDEATLESDIQLAGANFLLFLLSTQHSALSSSPTANCQLSSLPLPISSNSCIIFFSRNCNYATQMTL